MSSIIFLVYILHELLLLTKIRHPYFTYPQLELFRYLKPQCERRLMPLFAGDIDLNRYTP